MSAPDILGEHTSYQDLELWPRQRMVTDNQVRRLRKLSNTEKNQEIAASKAGMDPKTARKYLGLSQLPSEVITVRHWRTREDPFSASEAIAGTQA